jgi:XisI protein
MDKLVKYRGIVRQVLASHAGPPEPGDVETEIIADETGDHYMLLYIGWRDEERIRGCTLHLDIKDGRIWIQHDGIEDGVAGELLTMGVPKEDIVLGFRSPARRKYTDFAAA